MMATDPNEIIRRVLENRHQNKTQVSLASLPPKPRSAWPRFTKNGHWRSYQDQLFARVNAREVEAFRQKIIPQDWTASLNAQVDRLADYCGRIDRKGIEEQIAAVPGHRQLIARRFGAGLADRTVYLALAGPGLFHAAAQRHREVSPQEHGLLVERLVFNFLHRMLPGRGFHNSLRAALSPGTFNPSAGYQAWLQTLPSHSVRVTALIAPFAGYSSSASQLELRAFACERRCFVEIGLFVLAQLAAQLPEIVEGTFLTGPGDIFRPTGYPEDSRLSCGIFVDCQSVQINPNQNWLAEAKASSILAIL